MNFLRTFEKFQYSSDKVRFDKLQNSIKNNTFDSEPSYSEINDSLWDFDGTFILKKDNIIEFREYWVESCWEALYKKPEYKGLSKYDAMINFINNRFKGMCDKINLKVVSYHFDEGEEWDDWDILKVYLKEK